MPSISVRLKKTSNVSGRVGHDFRTRIPSYADPERKALNSVILGGPLEQNELRKDLETRHRKEAGKARRKDSALIYEGIITFSVDADLTDREAFDKAAERLLEEIAKRHGFASALWLVRHEDESRPHYHFAFANAHAETAKPVRLSPNDLRQIQDLAGETFADLGISRGKPKAQRIADGEPQSAYINRSVKQLHNDLPKEIAELEEKLKTNEQRLQKTLSKLAEASEMNEKLEKRAKTYEKRIKTLEDELERLRQLIEPHKPKPQKIVFKAGERETGWWFFKRKEPVLKRALVYSPKALNKALIATRKAAEEEAEAEARRKAAEAVKSDLSKLKRFELQQEQIFKALEAAGEIGRLPCAEPAASDNAAWENRQPPTLRFYNATLADFGNRVVAVGDGSARQQAAALYKASREKGWKKTVFWGMNKEQIEWLVKAAERDGYNIEFAEPWAQEFAEKLKSQLHAESSKEANAVHEAERDF
jgi:DNA-binding transcriptional regulator GbsR (MarR family)